MVSADRDSKLGKFCVCSTVCMHADSADRSAMAFANFTFRGLNFRAILRKLDPREKKGLYSILSFMYYSNKLCHFSFVS